MKVTTLKEAKEATAAIFSYCEMLDTESIQLEFSEQFPQTTLRGTNTKSEMADYYVQKELLIAIRSHANKIIELLSSPSLKSRKESKVSEKIEHGIYKNNSRQSPKGMFHADSLAEAVQKVARFYGISSYHWQAIPSRILMNSEESILYDVIDIQSDSATREKVYLKLPYMMTDSEIERQLPTEQ